MVNLQNLAADVESGLLLTDSEVDNLFLDHGADSASYLDSETFPTLESALEFLGYYPNSVSELEVVAYNLNPARYNEKV